MKENKEKKEMYCSYEYFMKHRCNGCKLGRECEEWNERISKMDSSDNLRISAIPISNDTNKCKVQKATEQS